MVDGDLERYCPVVSNHVKKFQNILGPLVKNRLKAEKRIFWTITRFQIYTDRPNWSNRVQDRAL